MISKEQLLLAERDGQPVGQGCAQGQVGPPIADRHLISAIIFLSLSA